MRNIFNQNLEITISQINNICWNITLSFSSSVFLSCCFFDKYVNKSTTNNKKYPLDRVVWICAKRTCLLLQQTKLKLLLKKKKFTDTVQVLTPRWWCNFWCPVLRTSKWGNLVILRNNLPMLVGDGCLWVFTHKFLIAFVDDVDDVVVQEMLIPGTNGQILVGCLVQTKSNRNEMGWKLEGGGVVRNYQFWMSAQFEWRSHRWNYWLIKFARI